MSFRIFFRGLIAHVQVEGSTTESRAVLVNAKRHDPTLIVQKGAFKSKTGDTPPETILGNGDRLFDLTGWDMSIDGVTNVLTKRTQSFLEHVPSLKMVLVDANAAKKKVKDDIHKKKHITNVTFSYVDYKDGTIEAIDCYTDAVEFDDPQKDDPECVVEVTMYSVELGGDVPLSLTKSSLSGKIIINPNSSVSVSNRSGKGNHFREYRKITDAADIRVPDANGRVCVDCIPRDDEDIDHDHDHDHDAKEAVRHEHQSKDLKKKGRPAAGTVECTQSGYP